MARKKGRSITKKNGSLIERVGDELDFPAGAMPGTAHIEISGNREVIVEGCKGVLEYDEKTIRLNTGKLILRLEGSELTISALQAEQAIIRGNILSLDFS